MSDAQDISSSVIIEPLPVVQTRPANPDALYTLGMIPTGMFSQDPPSIPKEVQPPSSLEAQSNPSLASTSAQPISQDDSFVTLLSDPQIREKVLKVPNYQSLTLKELLSALKTSSDVGGSWADSDDSSIQTDLAFKDYRSARRFTISVLSSCRDHDPISYSILNSADGKSLISVSLKSHDHGGVTTDDVVLANYINYCYALYQQRAEEGDDDYWYWDLYTNPKDDKNVQRYRSVSDSEVQQLNLPLSNAPLQCFSSVLEKDGEQVTQYFAKVPVATIGSWKHPVYKTVSFCQKDYDQIIQNFSDSVLGFEPPLFLGHPLNTDTLEGAPAEGFLTSLQQEGSELYGIYEIVDEQTYSDIQKGKYRYASAEVIRNYKDHSGTNKGIILFGHALTNRPFVPNLPRVEAMSHQQRSFETLPQLFTLDLSQAIPMTQQSQVQTPETMSGGQNNTPAVSTQQNLSQTQSSETTPSTIPIPSINSAPVANASLEALSLQITAMQQSHNQTVQSLSTRLEAAQNEISNLKQVNRTTTVNAFTKEIAGMLLAQELKDTAIQKLSSGELGSGEEDYMNVLRSADSQLRTMLTTQQGVSETTEAAQSPDHPASEASVPPVDNPYKGLIDSNLSIAKANQGLAV